MLNSRVGDASHQNLRSFLNGNSLILRRLATISWNSRHFSPGFLTAICKEPRLRIGEVTIVWGPPTMTFKSEMYRNNGKRVEHGRANTDWILNHYHSLALITKLRRFCPPSPKLLSPEAATSGQCL